MALEHSKRQQLSVDNNTDRLTVGNKYALGVVEALSCYRITDFGYSYLNFNKIQKAV